MVEGVYRLVPSLFKRDFGRNAAFTRIGRKIQACLNRHLFRRVAPKTNLADPVSVLIIKAEHRRFKRKIHQSIRFPVRGGAQLQRAYTAVNIFGVLIDIERTEILKHPYGQDRLLKVV